MNAYLGRRNVVWKTPSVTADGLKIFACAAMLLQSIGVIVIERGIVDFTQYTQAQLSQALADDSRLMVLVGVGVMTQLVGGLAVPIFAFLLVEGFRNTSSYKKYLLSMACFAVLAEIPFDFAMEKKIVDPSGQNALVSMCVCLAMLYFLRMLKDRKGVLYKAAECAVVVSAALWTVLLRTQYGVAMVLLTAIFYIFYSRNVLKTVLGIIVSVLYITGPLAFYGIWCYNEKRRDRLPKYAYYAFYPLHLLALGAVAALL